MRANRFAPVAWLAILLAACSALAATDPGMPGPFAPGAVTLGVPATSGATLTTDVHFPDDGAGGVEPAAGRCPLIVLGHGFSSSRTAHVGQGRHLASRGYVVLIPDFAGFSDHSRNADDLVALVTWGLERDADPGSFLFGRIDRSAIGATGHSAGGLSSIVATARDPRIRALAPMDPVDNSDLGVGRIGSITVPVAITYSEDSSCNANGSARTLYASAVPVKRSVKIVGANHCDPLDPSNLGCNLFCGAAAPSRQEEYRRLVTGWFEYWLRCDESYFDWVFGGEIQAGVAAGLLTYAAEPDPGPLPCGTARPPEVQDLRARRRALDVDFSWTAVPPPVDAYRLYRADSLPFAAGAPRATAVVEAASDASAVDGSFLYFYIVRAANTAGEGP